MKHYVSNRRDCWGFVAGASPLSVKRLIWEHEGEELMGDKAAGKVDHITLAVQEGKIFGLSPGGLSSACGRWTAPWHASTPGSTSPRTARGARR